MKHYFILLMTLLPMAVLAESEYGLWESVSVSKDLGTRWGVGAEMDLRTTDFLKSLSRAGLGVDADYKVTRWLKLGAGYTYMYDHTPATLKATYKKSTGVFNGYNDDAAYWRSKHRLTFDMTGKWKIGRFSLALRERYQYTHFMPTECQRVKYRGPVQAAGVSGELIEKGGYYFWPDEVESVVDDKPGKNTHILRSRLAVEYNIRHCPVTPAVTYEIQNRLDDSMAATKHRLTAGIEWKLSKKYYITADYVYQHEFRPEEYELGNLHVLSLGAKIKL